MYHIHGFFIIGFLTCLISIHAFSEPLHKTQKIFPLQEKHVHGSSLVQLPNGDILAAWFHGSGERNANDVQIRGARLKHGSNKWSDVFLMADTPNLPDCNPVLFLDRNEKLWMFWIAVRANRWEHSILRVRSTTQYNGDEAPTWEWQDLILLQPGEKFAETIEAGFDELDPAEDMWAEYAKPYTELLIQSAQEKNKRQEGWMTRNHPIQLPSGRILLPLYSDGFNMGLAAISDDDGATWRASRPIVGLAGIQPTLVQKKNGDICAYMRDTGGAPYRVLQSISKDHGESWSVMRDTKIPNPSSSLEVQALNHHGYWIMVFNDTEEKRNSLAVALSDDEGKSWKWKRTIGDTEYYAYPSLIEDRSGRIHISYTFSTNQGKTINHDVFSIDWLKKKNHSN